MLDIRNLRAGYGRIEIVHDVDLAVDPSAVAVILGHNGAGKSTTLKAVIGKADTLGGTITFDGEDITRTTVADCVARGIVMVPENGRVFMDLTVSENLDLGGYTITDPREAKRRRAEALDLFPRLTERLRHKGRTLSGGERQQLAIARALMMAPRLLLLEEPFLGLSPAMREVVTDALATIRDTGVAMLVVEHNVQILELASAAYVMSMGRFVITESQPSTLLTDDRLERAYVG
jgi:branched-chain amino acid transport system ATP-binding protein